MKPAWPPFSRTRLEHVVLGHRIDAQYAFFDRLAFDDKETFRHFGFARTPEEEQAARQKAVELLKNSPYKDQLAAARLFIQALESRSWKFPTSSARIWVTASLQTGRSLRARPQRQPPEASVQHPLIVALPIGGRIKVDPWSDELQMIKSQPVGSVAEREKMPFEITPLLPYLTREGEPGSRSQTAGALSQAPQEQ